MALRLVHTSTLGLETINGQHIPEYAILSHDWVDGEEISYQDMISIRQNPSHPASQKSGYLKILKTCEIARHAGLQYAWVDTCCIDKSSSEYLNEAINSMFQWYQAATVCFAYLRDLPPRSNLDDRMPRCRWFTRGWCLQELIAPRDVRFYNSSWEYIGSKSDPFLSRLISRITKIDENVLANTKLLSTLSVAHKMSWAAQRETTKPEDMAYCLLGVFDVNMPLLYGEGPKAFLRLQEEIIKRSNDLSIFAWGHPATTRPQRRDVRSLNHLVDGAENDISLPAGHAACCDLFAQSPSDFSDCGNLVLQTTAAQRNFAFSVTNNGLFFSRMNLRVDFENGCYVLPLLCYEKGSPLDGTYLALKKIGPDLFARLHYCHWENLFRWNRKIDGYVVTKMTPETRTLVEKCYVECVQLWSPSCSKQALHASILEISPQETWDPSNLAFLHDDDHDFSGFVKLDGRILGAALTGLADPGWDNFHLAWGGLYLTDATEPSTSRLTLWVRFFLAEEWENFPDTGHQILFATESEDLAWRETDHIATGPEVIEAKVVSIGELGSEYFRIEIRIRSTR